MKASTKYCRLWAKLYAYEQQGPKISPTAKEEVTFSFASGEELRPILLLRQAMHVAAYMPAQNLPCAQVCRKLTRVSLR